MKRTTITICKALEVVAPVVYSELFARPFQAMTRSRMRVIKLINNRLFFLPCGEQNSCLKSWMLVMMRQVLPSLQILLEVLQLLFSLVHCCHRLPCQKVKAFIETIQQPHSGRDASANPFQFFLWAIEENVI